MEGKIDLWMRKRKRDPKNKGVPWLLYIGTFVARCGGYLLMSLHVSS